VLGAGGESAILVLSTSTKGASAGTTTPIDIFDGDNKLDLRYVTGLSMAREDRPTGKGRAFCSRS